MSPDPLGSLKGDGDGASGMLRGPMMKMESKTPIKVLFLLSVSVYFIS